MNRICMVVLSLYPQDVRVRREAEALAREGIAVDILCLRDTGQEAMESFGLVTAYRIMDQRSKERIESYLMLSLQFTLTAFGRLIALSRKHRYALIQVHNMPDYLVFTGLLHRLMGRPLVLDLHDLSVELFQSKWSGNKSAVLLPIVKLTEKFCCWMANAVITTSQGFKDRLLGRGIPEDKITLVLNTADPNIFQYWTDREFHPIEQGARLLYHGTVAERFGLLTAVEAMALLQKTVPGSQLNIYGKYDLSFRQALEAKIAELGLAGNVILNGMKSLEEINSIIRQTDIGIVPYLSDEFMNLALSTKTFEYAATGLPTVASRVNSLTGLLDDECVCYATPGDANSLAEKIAWLCGHPERRRSQAVKARESLSEIGYSVMIGRYLKLMKRLMEGG